MRRMLEIGLALLTLYALICFAVVVFQERLVFVPERALVATPAEIGLTYEDVRFEATDGTRLHAWYVPGGETVVLVCHGNAGNISGRLETLASLASIGVSSFIFDYRGYGRSEGRPSERGTAADAEGARRWLLEERGVDPGRLVYFGRSLGGAVAIALAEHHPPAAIVIEETFSTLADLGQRVYPFLPVRLLLRVRYDSVRRVASLACPKLFFHSTSDDVVPFELGHRLYEAAAEPKRFVKLSGGHGSAFLSSGPVYLDAWRSFLSDAGLPLGR